MRDISLAMMQCVRRFRWAATPSSARIRIIERDYPNVPDTVHNLLAPSDGVSPKQIQSKLVATGYIGGCMDVLDVEKVLWYLVRQKRVKKVLDLTDGNSREVFLRLAL